jgi:Tripartite tricarboxylate transporter TctB family
MHERRDAAVAIVGAAFGLAALIAIPSQIKGQSYDAPFDVQSPAFFPILIALLMIAVSVGLFAARFLVAQRRDASAAGIPQPQSDETGPIEAPVRLAAAVLCLLLYYASLDLVGMVAGSAALIVVLSLVLGFRRYGIIAAVAAIVPAALYFAFQKGLYVMLPAGTLF